jgi:hypothetical protein
MQRPCLTVLADMFLERKRYRNIVSYPKGRIQIEGGVRQVMLRRIYVRERERVKEGRSKERENDRMMMKIAGI